MLFNRRLADVLFTAAWASIKALYKAVQPNCKAGAVFELHTHGEELKWHPHLHAMATDGVFDSAGNFHQLSLDLEKLGLLFSAKVLKKLKKHDEIPGLREACEQLATQEHTGFGAWAGEVINPEDKGYQLSLSRYLDHTPAANNKIEIEGDELIYYQKDGAAKVLDPLEYLARLTTHVPEKYESRRRYVGYYSHIDRGRRAKEKKAKEEKEGAAAAAGSQPVAAAVFPATSEKKKRASKRWAELIKKVFNIDPLICSKCGSQMQIKSFITDTAEVKRLLDNLHIPGWVQPEKISSGSSPGEGPPEVEDSCFVQ